MTNQLNPENPEDRLIFALDVPDLEQALHYEKCLEGIVGFYKVGWELFLAEGLKIIRELKDRNHKVFLDLKIQDDVDETINRYIQVVINEGVDFVTLHGNGKMFSTAKKAKGASALQLLSVTLLSNMDEAAMKDNYMIQNGDDEEASKYCLPFENAEDYVAWRAEKTAEAGCDGFIASGRFVKHIKNLFDNNGPFIVTPGVRPSGYSHAEHKNVLSPGEAIRDGSDYLVVGRPIRDAPSSSEAAKKIVEEIAKALESPVTP